MFGFELTIMAAESMIFELLKKPVLNLISVLLELQNKMLFDRVFKTKTLNSAQPKKGPRLSVYHQGFVCLKNPPN